MTFLPLPLPQGSCGISGLGEILKLIYELQSVAGKFLNLWDLCWGSREQWKSKSPPSREEREKGGATLAFSTLDDCWVIGGVFDN
jgi:hypothetical protein